MSVIGRFATDRSGTTAVLFGLSMLPIVGAAGAAVDYARANAARAALQKAADQTALTMVIGRHNGQTLDYRAVFADALARTGSSAGTLASPRATLDVAGTWIVADKQFKVTASGSIPTSLMAVFQPAAAVGASATALGVQNASETQIQGANLDPEAWDYNELQAYCYNGATRTRQGPIDPQTGQRTTFPKIADNTPAGVRATPANLTIRCGSGEQVSYALKNITNANHDPSQMTTGRSRTFYTDATKADDAATTPTAYAVSLDGAATGTLETVLCASRAECQPRASGGILPDTHQTGRTPATNTRACQTGQYLYFGWEDRLISEGSDRDFDDIRLVISCPKVIAGPFTVRLTA